MLGVVLQDKPPAFAGSDKYPSLQMVNHLHQAGMLTVPAGTNVIRLLPALNLKKPQAEEALDLLRGTLKRLNS